MPAVNYILVYKLIERYEFHASVWCKVVSNKPDVYISIIDLAAEI